MSRTKPRKAAKQTREILTPEGVTLTVELADRGDRAGAVMVDLLILFVAMILSFIGVAVVTGWANLGRFGIIAILLLLFFFRNFYFMFFELKWQGQTPGKRRMKIKVIDRFGRPLTSEAIFARNMMREIELFLPMGIVFSFGGGTGMTGMMQLFAFLWAMLLVCLPLMNRDNLRAGDLIAGTIVVREPDIMLASDMLGSTDAQPGGAGSYGFSSKHLDAYGIFELQTLEGLLRASGPGADEKRQTAGETIIKKIGWQDPVPSEQMAAFLSAYYYALRQHLEGRLLMGNRKEDKFDTGKQPKK